jgi:hypothetical protein
MSNNTTRTLLLAMFSAAFGYADSVTWIDRTSTGSITDRTLNGRLIKIEEGKLSLEARFASGPKAYEIPVSQVRRIEFTNIFFNPGAPPQVSALGEGPKAPSSTTPTRALVAYAIELRGSGGELVPCKVLSIDEMTVRCEAKGKAKPNEYLRTQVLRIIVRVDQ